MPKLVEVSELPRKVGQFVAVYSHNDQIWSGVYRIDQSSNGNHVLSVYDNEADDFVWTYSGPLENIDVAPRSEYRKFFVMQ